ncbi:PfkB family carbohydrate kinase [Clavibacter michiganensis]|uniref:PfkB family carbohydrate kinase n=1 Tax=Clavibacter michiganensis TaxID=28447 RepID=UPI0026DBD8FF|nr:PfkB family carbohydrate kinase [Clavibacter michiganensis]MDO4027415.1 PfkB family carbohydrate kinase [Clavibacter michiganensis]MDO4065470.1 PfkB family carbohydrate kinase [Clavibacter michiganensis]MDO4070767.1 PfkB family carbohydrate kinase [Clavibacter michiganensis]MDO4089187.1 PfkB family carbohydrate kinase [Clavibacter michiganensis]
MIISGGTYRENVVLEDHHEDLGGSGFRAAHALCRSDTTLYTAVESPLASILSSATELLNFSHVNIGRNKSVGFDYLSPFVTPQIRGFDAILDQTLTVEGETILAFGMVEKGRRGFSADSIVYDPQTVNDPGLQDILDSRRKRLALSANVVETQGLGGTQDVKAAALAAMRRTGADVAVTKAGARGCLVSDLASGIQEWIGAYPTTSLTKLGSGDVFSAAFAAAWFDGAETVDAARIASRATAWWCSNGSNRIPSQLLSGKHDNTGKYSSTLKELSNDGAQPLVYLAGPFFTPHERWLIDSSRDFLIQAGARVFSPVHEVGLGGPGVASSDLAGLDSADVVFAILDGWDPGTVFETGWASRQNIPVVAYLSNHNEINTTMLVGTGAEIHSDLTTAMYRSIWVGLGADMMKGGNR